VLKLQRLTWRRFLLAVTVDGKAVDIGNDNQAAIDTGTTLIGAPTAAVAAIWGAVPNSVPLTGNMTGFFSFRAYIISLFDGGTRQGCQASHSIADVTGPSFLIHSVQYPAVRLDILWGTLVADQHRRPQPWQRG
jgi:hypothetical protein